MPPAVPEGARVIWQRALAEATLAAKARLDGQRAELAQSNEQAAADRRTLEAQALDASSGAL